MLVLQDSPQFEIAVHVDALMYNSLLVIPLFAALGVVVSEQLPGTSRFGEFCKETLLCIMMNE